MAPLTYGHVDSSMRSLASQAEGFGRFAVGGVHGKKRVAFKYYMEKAADKEQPQMGYIDSEGDLFVTGTQAGLMPDVDQCSILHPREFYPRWTVEPPTDPLKQVLQHCTGWPCLPVPADKGIPI